MYQSHPLPSRSDTQNSLKPCRLGAPDDKKKQTKTLRYHVVYAIECGVA